MEMKSYYLTARLFPTILTSIPAIWACNLYISNHYHQGLKEIYSGLPAITDVVLSGAIIFLLVQVNRFLAKEIIQNLYFKDELKMPTTDFLLKSDETLDKSIKKKIEQKISTDFNIKLLSISEEAKDEIRARKLIATAVSQIRLCMRKNPMLFQHNIEYGFARNLIGGSILAVTSGTVICITARFQGDHLTEQKAYIAISLYLIPLIFSKLIIFRYGRDYAKILYEQFLASGRADAAGS